MAISRKSRGVKKSKAAPSARPKKTASKRAVKQKAKSPVPRKKAGPKRATRPGRVTRPQAAAKPKKAVKAVSTKATTIKAVVPAASAPRPPASSKRGKPGASGAPKPAATKAVKGKGSAVPARKGKAPPRAIARQPAEVRPIGMLPQTLIARANAKSSTTVPRPVPRKPPVAKTPPQGVQTVTEDDIKDLETRLLSERQRILKEMGHLENTVFKVNQRDSSGDLSGYAFHMADAGTDAMEREKAFLFASAEGRTLMEVNDALRRLYQGDYGACESCSQPIGRARLQAIPQARLCLSCKEKEERSGRGAS